MSFEQIIKSKFNYLIFLFTGIILSFSLPPYNYISFCFLVFPFLLYLLKINKDQSAKSFFLCGLSFAFGYFASSLYWISYSLNFDPAVTILKPFAILVLPFILSIFYGFCFYILKRFFNFGFFYVLNFSILLALTEYFRSYITGFSWNLFVYALSDEIQSIQILNYIGTFGLNFLAIFFFSFPFLFFNENKRKSVNRMIIFVLIIGVNYLYGYARLQIELENKEQNIVLVQPNEGLIEIASYPDDYIQNLIKISNPKEKLDDAIFLWPEGSYSFLEPNSFKKIIKGSFKANQKIILGGNTKENENIYNTLIVFNSDGEVFDYYHKIHLVPFGEFIPFENFLLKFGLKKVTFGYQSFSRGNERKALNINNIKILPLICYEVIDTGLINPNQEQYDVIFNISEDGWFNRSIGTYQHYAHSIFRSIEEGKHIFRSTNQGLSASINPYGVPIKISTPKKQDAFVTNYQVLKGKTAFSVLGNTLFFFIILISFLIQLFCKRYFKLR